MKQALLLTTLALLAVQSITNTSSWTLVYLGGAVACAGMYAKTRYVLTDLQSYQLGAWRKAKAEYRHAKGRYDQGNLTKLSEELTGWRIQAEDAIRIRRIQYGCIALGVAGLLMCAISLRSIRLRSIYQP